MTLTEHCTVTLPHYKLSNELQKDNLYRFCISDMTIKEYLPDDISLESIQRDFMFSVRIYFNYLADLFYKTRVF